MTRRESREGRGFIALIVVFTLVIQLLQPALAQAASLPPRVPGPSEAAMGSPAAPLTGTGLLNPLLASLSAAGSNPAGQLGVAPRSQAAPAGAPASQGAPKAETVKVPLLALAGKSPAGQARIPANQDKAPGQGVIVKYKRGAGKAMVGADALGTLGLQAASGAGKNGLQLLQALPGADLETALANLRANPQVEYAEPNYVFAALDTNGGEAPAGTPERAAAGAAAVRAQALPNDPEFANQWGLTEVQVSDAWDEPLAGDPAPVTVAVVDTGVDAAHEDLVGRVLDGHNFVTGAPDPTDANDDSQSGHGTHVAGIIAATTNNGIGVAGVTGSLPVSVLPVKVLDATGTGTMFDVAQGIYWATDQGVRVINVSLGARLPDFPLTLAEAVQYAQDHGVLVVAAAGNEYGKSVDGFYPAGLPKVIPVAASGGDHKPAAFSNRSGVTAPGVNILSTLPGNRYGTMSGTSMAAPFVAATAALLWSRNPANTVAEVSHAVINGHSDFSEGCTYYWWGRSCTTYIYVLSAYEALFQLEEYTWDNIDFIQPEDGDHVFGQTELKAEVPNPANVARVKFFYDPSDLPPEQSVIDVVYGPAAGERAESGLFSAAWDTTTVENGEHELLVQSFDVDDQVLASDYTTVLVENEFRSGLQLQIRKPDETPAAGALVRVFHATRADDGAIELIDSYPLWQGPADLQGRVVVSGFNATDGNSYLVTAQGTEPDFFYHALLKAPSQTTLGPATAKKVTLQGERLDGQPLSRSLVLADLVDVRVEGGDYWSPGMFSEVPVTVLSSQGDGEVWVSSGQYNFRLVSPADAYYLQQQVVVGAEDQVVAFPHTADQLASVELNPDGDMITNGVQLGDADGSAFVGFDGLLGTNTVTVTPGNYSALVQATVPDPTYDDGNGNSRTWTWELFVPTFELTAGQHKAQPYGGHINATVTSPSWGDTWQPGWAAFVTALFPDAHGNLTAYLGYELTAAGAGTAAAAASLSNVIVRVPSPASAKPEAGSQPPAAAETKSFRYNPTSQRLEPLATSLTPASKVLEIRDSSGALVDAGSKYIYWFGEWFDPNPGWPTGYWAIPWGQPDGEYTAQTTLPAGPLGPPETGGTVVSDPSTFKVVTPSEGDEEPPPLTVRVLDRLGDPLPDTTVYVLQRVGNAYYPAPGYPPTTNQEGIAEYWVSMDADTQYALAVWAWSRLPEDETVEEPMFLFIPLARGEPPLSVTVDASAAGLGMTRVTLLGVDEAGQLLPADNLVPVIYGQDADGAVGGISLPSFTSGAAATGTDSGAVRTSGVGHTVVWVPSGRYTFQLDLNANPYVRPSSAAAGDSYYLVQSARVPEDLDENGHIVLGGPGLARFEVQGPAGQGPAVEAAGDTVALGGYALLSATTQMPFAEVFRGPVYVTPDTYYVESLVARYAYDGEWDYWLEKQVTAGAAESVTEQVYANFSAALSLDGDTYSGGETVHSTHTITDSNGNRLVAILQDLGVYTSSLGTAATRDLLVWRTPQSGLLFSRSSATGAAQAGADGEQPVDSLNHDRIAPFLVIDDPSGKEIYRYKDEGPDFDNLAEGGIAGYNREGTFFSGWYTLPEHPDAGTYTARLEVGTGPDGLVTSPEQTFTVGGVGAAPRLNALPALTNALSIEISGTATAGAEVTVMQSVNGGAATQAGVTTAGEDGSFSLTVSLADAEGTYVFTATASLGGETSPESQPVTIEVDRTKPAPPLNPAGEAEDQNHIRLNWSASPSTDVASYSILRGGEPVVEVPVGSALTYLDGGLDPLTEYEYSLLAVDLAGNVSDPAVLRVSTSAAPDVEPPSAPSGVKVQYRTGGMADVTWDAATDNIQVAGYHVWRAETGHDAAQLGAVAGDAVLAYRDDGLAAETEYTYTVTAFDDAGNESPASAAAILTTPAMPLSAVTWRPVPGAVAEPLLRPGAEILIRLLGERGRQASAEINYEVWADGGEGPSDPQLVAGARRTTLELSESATKPGVYEARFTLPAGTASLHSISGSLADGLGHTTGPVAATGLPKNVGGTARITLDFPASAYDGLSMLLWSASEQTGASTAASIPGEQTLAGLKPATDYHLTVFTPWGHQVAEVQAVAILPGRTTVLAIVPQVPASLQVNVVDSAGAPLPQAYVSITDTTTNEVFSGIGFGAGKPATFYRLWEGDTVNVTAQVTGESLDLPVETQVQGTMTLGAGSNLMTLTFDSLPTGTITGVTRNMQGESLAGIIVTGSVRVTGRFINARAVSDGGGHYTLRLPSGDAAVDAGSEDGEYRLTQPVGILVRADGGEATANLSLDTLGYGNVTITLRTRYAEAEGGPWQERSDLQWQDTAHFHLQVQGGLGGYPVLIKGRPGQTLIASVDGREVGLPAQTKEFTLDAQRNGHVTFELEEQGRIIGRLVDAQGQPITGKGWWAHISDASGARDPALADTQMGLENSVLLHLQKPGKYRVEFMTLTDWNLMMHTWDWQTGSYAAFPRAVYGEVEVTNVGRIIDLGDIHLSYFGGGLAGTVTSSPHEATPGALLNLRADFGLAPNTVPFTANDAELVLAIPDGATLVPDSVTLDGSPVAVGTGATITVPLGDMRFEAGQRHSVHYQVSLDADLGTPSLLASAYVAWGPEASRGREDFVPATVPLGRVSLNAPSRITRLNLTLWGRAPAGSTVSIYDNQVLLGQALASPGGFWYLAVDLPDLGAKATHALQATAATDTETFQSAVVSSFYDPDQPELVSFSMGQDGGRQITVDPTTGLPTFPFVVVPGQPFRFTLGFNEPARVSNVKVFIGNYEMKAQGPDLDGRFVAVSPPINYRVPLGDVYVKYDVSPPIEDLKDEEPPTPEEQKEELPQPLRDYEVLESGTLPADPTKPNQRGAWVNIKPQPGSDLMMRVEVTIETGVQHPLTDADWEEIKQSGVHDLTFTSNMPQGNQRTKTLELHATGLIPESLLDTTQPPLPVGAQGLIGAQGLDVVVKVGTKVEFTSGQAFNAYDWGSSLKDGFGVPDTFAALDALLNMATNCDDAADSAGYKAQVDSLAERAMAIEATKWGMMLAGTLLGPETFGIGTVLLWGASKGMEYGMDRSLKKSMDALRKEIAANPDCKREDEPDEPDDPNDPDRPTDPDDPWNPPDPIIRPVFTWDPSGHVYEAVDSNRLEGVTATVFQWNEGLGAWVPWDAAWFGLQNPQITDPQGAYGWDVPSGDWQVLWEKPGYEPAHSPALTVPPPRTEVNAGLVSQAAPQVASLIATTGGAYIQVTFDQYMDTKTVTASTFLVSRQGPPAEAPPADPPDGEAPPPEEEPSLTVTGTIEPVSPATAPDGSMLAKAFRFVPSAETPLNIDETYEVTIESAVQNYAGRPLLSDYVHTVTVSALEPPLPPAEVTNATVTAGDGSLVVTWTDPTDANLDKVCVYWRPQSGSYGTPAEVAKGTGAYTISGLTSDTTYEIKITTVSTEGAESAGVTLVGTPTSGEVTPPSPPAEVTNATVTPGDGSLVVTWTDPTDANLDKVRVYWRTQGGSYGTPAEVAKGVGANTISGLTNNTTYEIKITTVSTEGAESTGVTVTGKPQAPVTPPPPSGGGGAAPPPSNEFHATVGQGAKTLDAFGGDVTITIAAGTFPAGTTLVLRKLDVPGQLGSGLTAGSTAYELDAGGATLTKPITLTLSYNNQLLGSIDVRTVGIYRQDEGDPTHWIYVGGVVGNSDSRGPSAGGTVTVGLTHFSTYAVLADQPSFADLTNHWSRADIEVLASRHVVGGVSPQQFQPDRTITRAELAKLLVEMVRRSRPDVAVIGGNIPTFTDVPTEAWYYPYIETAARLGLLKGDAGKARPDASVTREEMAAMLIRAMSLESQAAAAARSGAGTLPYSDAAKVAAWAKGYVALARQLGVMQGVTQNEFQPQASATRAQGAVVILRAMEQQGLILKPVTLTGTVRLTQLEGAHLELEVTVAGQLTKYVLLPVGGASGDLAARLTALDGKQAQIKGVLDGSLTTYMSGPALKVFEVTPL